MRLKYKSIAAIVVIAVVLGGCGAKTNNEAPKGSEGTTASANEEAASWESFTTTDLDGNEVTGDILANSKLTMVNIWGTFCNPCIREMPHLGEIANELSKDDFQIMGIVMDVVGDDGAISADKVAEAKEMVETTKADYLHVVPSNSLIDIKLSEVYSIPETLFLDKEGKMVGDSVIGSKSKEEWLTIIDERLAMVK